MLSQRCVIIGGGVIGCAIAWRLAQRGFQPLVLDRGLPGGEASSAAAGIIAPQQEAERAGPGLDAGLRSRAMFPAFVDELRAVTGVDVGYRACGLIALADEAGVAALDARATWQEAAGLRVDRLTAAEVRRLEPALGDCAAALYLPDEAQLDPVPLVRALQLAALRAGAQFSTAEVRRIVHDGDALRAIEIEGRRIACSVGVVAAGSWSAQIEGAQLHPGAVRPIRGQMLELETRPPPIEHIVFAPGGYLVPRCDGRVVVGSTMEGVGFRKEVTVAGLEKLCALAMRAVPSLADAPLRRTWSGFRPFADGHLPYFGPTAIRGLYHATGHHRSGILYTPITADAVAAAVCGDAPPIDLAPFTAA